MVIKFNLSEIPSNADIVEAIYSMFFFYGDTAEQGNTNLCSLFTVSKQWVDDEVTWKNADKNTAWENTDPDTKFYNPLLNDTMASPGGCDFNRENLVLADYASMNDWENYNVTDIVKKIHTNEIPNYGFMVKQFIYPKTLQGNNPTQRDNYGKSYRSSEFDEVDKRPKLTVKYETTAIHEKIIGNEFKTGITTRQTVHSLLLFIPFKGSYGICISDLKGKRIFSTIHQKGHNWIEVPVTAISPGLYIIDITNSERNFISTFRFVR